MSDNAIELTTNRLDVPVRTGIAFKVSDRRYSHVFYEIIKQSSQHSVPSITISSRSNIAASANDRSSHNGILRDVCCINNAIGTIASLFLNRCILLRIMLCIVLNSVMFCTLVVVIYSIK